MDDGFEQGLVGDGLSTAQSDVVICYRTPFLFGIPPANSSTRRACSQDPIFQQKHMISVVQDFLLLTNIHQPNFI